MISASPPLDPEPAPASGTRAAGVVVAVGVGAGLLTQRAIPPDRVFTWIFGFSSMVLYTVVVDALPDRWRRAATGADAFVTLLGALTSAGLLVLLVVQGQTAAFYRATWGPLAEAILALRIDAAFGSLWFAGLVGAIAGTAILAAARRRSRGC